MYIKKIYKRLPSDLIKSIADQIKIGAWALGGLNTYFGHIFGSRIGWCIIIVGWCYAQLGAHYLIYKTSITEGVRNGND